MTSPETKENAIEPVEKESELDRTKSYLEQLLRFVDFKENVYLIIRKCSEIEKEAHIDVEIGYSARECKSLLIIQDNLELKCSELYSQYAVLRQQAVRAAQEKHFLLKQFMEYRDSLEKACLSLASSLVAKRNLIIASEKFHLILYEFRQKILEIKDFAHIIEDSDDPQSEMETSIQKIYIFIDQICKMGAAVFSQGLRLLQFLFRLNLPEKSEKTHRQHVGGWMTFVEVERDFRLVRLNRLAHQIHFAWQLRSCENGVEQTIEWLKDLSAAMLRKATEIGESAEEADALFLQHIQFKEAGEESLKFGLQLIDLATSIRQPTKCNVKDLQTDLEKVWEDFWKIFRGIAKRLDLCQNFYRNTKKHLIRLIDLENSIRSGLAVFGVIRQSFVVRRHKKAWLHISSSIEECLGNGRYLLQCLKDPLSDSHGVNLLSSSAAIKILRTMSETEKTAQQVQNTYFNDETNSRTESATAEYVSARSPDTWRSTSISGVEDWCSVGSDGATLDDFKSIDDDLAEEYLTDDNVEDLPLNGQSATVDGARRGSGLKEYAAVTGVQDAKGKKFTSNIQPGAVVNPALPSGMVPGPASMQSKPPISGVAPTSKPAFAKAPEKEIVAVSPKASTSFEPPKYSSVITKTETTDVKTEVQKTYEIKTSIKAGGTCETFTSQTSEATTERLQPDAKMEKVHKITVVEEPKKVHTKTSVADDFSKGPAFDPSSQSKTELLSEIEGLKSKYLKKTQDPSSKSSEVKTESKSENVSYGFSSFPGAETDVSKVVYSKELTESHSMTSISFQQQSFGVNRSERWQSITPQGSVQQIAQILPEPAESEEETKKLKEMEENMKESKEWIQLKIQEMHPAMTDIGSNLREVTELYQQHEKVLEKLQTKQSPVEELLRQADDLISTQKPRGEVYSAMAENLGLAWKDLNAQLEQRRQILEQAVAFFTKAEQFSDSMDAIQRSVSETFLPNTVESTVSILNRIKEERKVGLSNSMRMLGDGQLLLERLCEVATHSMGDSRPEHMRPAARLTAASVERRMEAEMDRWRNLEAAWAVKKGQLEQCLARCQLEKQLGEVEHWLRTKGSEFVSEHNLGDSLASSEILLHEHHKVENACKERQEHCLKLVKCAEDLQKQGNYAGEELRSKSYLLLSECADLMATLDQRRQLLLDTVNFFTKAQTAQTKLDQIEIQLSASESIAALWSTAEEVANAAIQDGRRILGTTGMTEPGAQGVARKVEELEWKKKKLCDLCKAKESKVSEKTVAFKKFCEKYDELIKWLSNNGQFFVQRTRDMGTTQTAAKAFLDQHETLQNDLRMKFMEVEALLRTVPNLVRSGGEEAEVVHSKSENLKQQFVQLRTTFEKRILIAQRYLAFLKLSTKVSKEMDELEALVKQAVASPDQSKFRSIEEKQFALRQEFLQMNNNGKNFLEDAWKVDDMYLNMTQPCATVEDILNRLELRNVSLNTQWLNLQNEITATKETLIHWDHLLKDSNRVLKCSQELERKLFPVIPHELYRADAILTFLEKRMSDVLPQIKSVQKEIEVLLKKSETSKPKDSTQAESVRLLQNLQDMNQTLQRRLTDYQILVSMMITFFKNHEELEKLVDMQESQFRMTSLPNDVTRLEVLMRDHESSKPTVMELFKFSYTELQQLIKKINESEPPDAAAKDIEKLSTIHGSRKQSFEKSWEEYKYKMEQHNQLCIFFRDMHLINQQIEDLNSQMASIRQTYGESLPSAVHTSEAFHQFEKTIEILQIRIQEFVSTAERLMRDQRVDTGQVHGEIETLQRKWSTFRTEVTTNRRLIEVAIEYYKTVEEAEEWLQEGSRLLISVARKSSTCTKESDADGLQKEIKDFLTKGKPKQEERLKKISTLSQQLYGNQPHPSTSVVTNKNKDMIDSFTVINTELNTLTSNIKFVQQAKIAEKRGKEEMDAAMHAAQAEAETAKAAATAALQAARAAEAAVSKPQQRPPRFLRMLLDAEVPEGTRHTFECEVDGEPAPQVQWFKDGILVENNPDYQTSVDRGVCKLTIEETFSEDTANFTCRAANPAGVAETQSQLIVKESRTPSELIPPHFVQEPADSTVAEFESHLLECQVFGNPLPLVSWFKDDACIDYSTDYSISYNNGHCSLRIEEASLAHQGRYTCRAVNPVGQVACSANILVQTTAPSERPTVVSPLSNVMARAGQKLRLECSIAGQPQPQVSWLHNSKSLKETRDTKLHFDGCNATLVITEAFPKDAGTYTIIARNKAGEAVSSCNVSVKGRLPLETSDSEIASDIEPAKPQVKQQLFDQTVSEGNKVRMDCIIVGQPEPEVIWYHNGKPVKESDDFQLLFEGDRCTLIIEVAYLEDAGQYRCVAINSGGEASSCCHLKVEPAMEIIQKSSSQFSQKDILVSIEKCDPPKFLKLLDNVIVTEGQEVLLECQVAGDPGTTLNWLKDGQQLSNTPEFQISSDASGISRLRIPSARAYDRGTYSARAHNKGGEAQSICSVFVSTPLTFGQTTQQAPPTFLQHVANQTLVLGGTARFETLVEGTPNPQVRWNFQGKPVPRDQHHDMGNDGDKKHWLIVKNISREHSGRYSAIAENDVGIATTSALLSIDGPSLGKVPICEEYQAQSMIMTRKAVMQTSTISSMSEVSDVDYQPPEFPSFSSLQSQQLVKREQSTFIQHRVEQGTTPAPAIRAPATQAPVVPAPSIPTPVPVVQPTVAQPIVPPAIQPQQIQQSALPRSEVLPKLVEVPPKFTRPVSTAVVTEGEKLFLEAQFEGVPEPTIQWLKDDVELKNKPGLQVTTCLGGRNTCLFVMKSAESDSGRYSCIASNSAGKATSIAEVKVKPYREAPKFKKKLQASVVKSGSRLELEVEATGVPVPDVKWYRNENQLKDSPDFRISSSANTHTLVISEVFPEDSGTYMVVASNLAGETKCLANLIVEEDRSPEEEKRITYQEFTSVQQTKQMFTKLSTNAQPTLQPLQCVTEIKSIEAPPPPPPKVPSPPPMPAASVKVWTQPKPQPFTPAITETQEPIPIPSPEPILEPEQFVPTYQDISMRTSEEPLSTQPIKPASFVSGMSESFVKQSIMKFSQPEVKQQFKSEETKTSVTFAPPPVVQNGVHSDMYSSTSTVSQSTVIFDSKSMSTVASGYPPPPRVSQVPKLSFVPKTLTSGSVSESEKKPTKVWQPKATPELKSTPQISKKPIEELISPPHHFPQSIVTDTFHSSTESKVQPTETTPFSSGGGVEKNTVFSSYSGTSGKTTSDTSKNMSTTSCQTSTVPSSSVYSTESSTTTRTSYSTKEISITKKYEVVMEHSSEVVSDSDASKVVPKPIIKKEMDQKPRPKKEVVIEEVPVVGAEVKPPHFAKVRGAESLRKIFTDI